MKWERAAMACFLVLAALAFSGCVSGAGGKLAPVQVCASDPAAQLAAEGHYLATGNGSFLAIWGAWQNVIVTAVLIILLVCGLVYAISNAIAYRNLTVWAQSQMYEAFATLVFAFLIVGIVSWMCGVDARIVGATCDPACGPNGCGCSVFKVADDYLSQFNGEISKAWWAVAMANMAIAALSTTVFSVGASGLGTTIGLGPGLSQVSASMSSALIMIGIAQLLTIAQLELLRLSAVLFVYLLPAGIVLRAFGITRGFGGGLIAIAIGFYLIYPLSIVFMYGLVDSQIHNQVGGAPGGSDESTWQQQASGPIVGWMCGLVGTILVGAAVVPFITFIIVVSFVRGLSQAIGEEVDVSNLTRLI